MYGAVTKVNNKVTIFVTLFIFKSMKNICFACDTVRRHYRSDLIYDELDNGK